MARNGQPNNQGYRSESGQSSSDLESLHALLDEDRGIPKAVSLLTDISRFIQQQRRQKLYTVTATADLGQAQFGPVLFPGGLHLPDQMMLGSLYIENNGASASLNVYEGPSGNGRLISTVKHGAYKVIVFADNISSCSIVASATNDTGLVVATISTHRWGPKTGTL